MNQSCAAKPTNFSPASLSLRKKLAYSAAVTIIVFAGVEFALAMIGIEPSLPNDDPYVGLDSSSPLFTEQQGAPSVMRTAENRLAFFNLQRFSRSKHFGTTRVFCLGGSTTYGRPYDDRTSFPGWLRELLSAIDPHRHWEVINAGGISYASYRAAAVLDELCQYDPDVFVIYTGHNEFLEERTYRDMREPLVGFRQMTTLLHKTRTYSLLDRLCDHSPRPILPGEVDAILDHSVGPETYHRDDKLRASVIEHFQFNLSRMIDAAHAVGAEVILVVPAANEKDFSPFKSEHRTDLTAAQRQQWSTVYQQAEASQQQPDEALAAYQLATEIDDAYADLHFRIGQLLFSQERPEQAGKYFDRAIDEDVCPLRCLSEMRAIVEQTAISRGVPLIDFPSILRTESLRHHGHSLLGNEYFLDHVHPTIEANRILATALAQAMILKGIVRAEEDWVDRVVPQVERRIAALVDRELEARSLTNLAQVLAWAGKRREAGQIAVMAVHLRRQWNIQPDAENLFYAAMYHATYGSDEQAIALLTEVIQLEPDNEEARRRLAMLFYDHQQFDDARYHFREALRTNPNNNQSRHMLDLLESCSS